MIDFESEEITSDPPNLTGFIDAISSVMLIFILLTSILILGIYSKTIEGERLTLLYNNKNISISTVIDKYNQCVRTLEEYKQYVNTLEEQLKEAQQLIVRLRTQTAELEKYKQFVETLKVQSEQKKQEYQVLVDSLTNELEKLKVKRIIIPNEMREKVFFDFGSDRIRSEFFSNLDEVYASIYKELKSGRYNFVQVEGHTDNVPIHRNNRKYQDNWDLGAARAIAVVRYLESKGISPEYLSAVTYSEYKPLSEDNAEDVIGEDIKKQNRRIEILLLKK